MSGETPDHPPGSGLARIAAEEAEPKLEKVRAIDVVPEFWGVWCTIGNGKPHTNAIEAETWGDDGTIHFLLGSHNFLIEKPDAILELVRLEPPRPEWGHRKIAAHDEFVRRRPVPPPPGLSLADHLGQVLRELERIQTRNRGNVSDAAYVASGRADTWEDANDAIKSLHRALEAAGLTDDPPSNDQHPWCKCGAHRLRRYMPWLAFSEFIHTEEKCAQFSLLGIDGMHSSPTGRPVLIIHWRGFPTQPCSYVIGGAQS